MKIASSLKYLIKKMKTQKSLKDYKTIYCVSQLFLALIGKEVLYEKEIFLVSEHIPARELVNKKYQHE
jgi:hypothetical protein